MTQQRDNRGRFAAGAGASAVGAGVAGRLQHVAYQNQTGFERWADSKAGERASDLSQMRSSHEDMRYHGELAAKHGKQAAKAVLEHDHQSTYVHGGYAQRHSDELRGAARRAHSYRRMANASAKHEELLRAQARSARNLARGGRAVTAGLASGAVALGVKAVQSHDVSKRDIVIRVADHQPRHTYTEGRHHRDTKGRFASYGAGALAATGMTGAGLGGFVAGMTQKDLWDSDARADKQARDFIDAAKVGDKSAADKFARNLKDYEELRPHLVRDRNRWALIGAGGLAAGTLGMNLHARANRRIGRVEAPVVKSWKERADSLRVTPEQARTAGTFGQIGAAGGTLGGAAIGAGIGAATRHPAQGAGLGALAGGAIGGGSGAALGLYGARPRKKKKLAGTAPSTLSKAFDGKKRGAVIGASSGLAAGGVIQAGATAASSRLKEEAQVAGRGDRLRKPGGKSGVFHDPLHAGGDLAAYKHKMSDARLLERTAAFHGSAKGRVGMAIGGALTGAALVRHHQRKIAGQVDIAKMSDETKTKLARGGLVGAQIADVAAIKSAWHETSTAKKTGTGIGSALSYGAKKAALPIVAGGLVASIGAERVMHSQQKKLKAAQTANLKPRKVAP